MKYRNIIFDLDGTLLDTSEGIKEAVCHTIQELGYKSINDEEMSKFIGPPIQNSLMDHFSCSIEEAQNGAEIFRDYYKNISLLKAKPYNGIYELLDYINQHGMNAAVATYKREDYALKLLCAFEFNKYCSVMHGADNFNRLSKADIIKMCVKELGGEIGQSLYIGDTYGDFMGAKECGVDFVGVTYGFGFIAFQKHSFLTIDDPMELISAIKNA